jgi:hypothetical protein
MKKNTNYQILYSVISFITRVANFPQEGAFSKAFKGLELYVLPSMCIVL